jgi:putative two-component system response regulator
MARQIALCHHERIDGGGYPAGLAGEAIPEAARMVAIVDFYDALSHHRVYRQSFPEDRVLKMLREGRGAHFDPRLLDVFLSLLPEMRAIAKSLPDDADDDEDDDLLGSDQVAAQRLAVPLPVCLVVPENASSSSEFA